MLTVSISQIPLVSFALVQNNVAIVRSVEVKNNTGTNLSGLKVRISFDPEFADTVIEHIVSLPAGEVWRKPDIRPSLNASYICNLTEKITAKTKVEVLSRDGEVLAETRKELSVLDYCQYWGNSFMSQYLAAFVTPRHIALDPVIRRASEILSSWTGSSSLSAYTRDVPSRPKMIIGAVYEAIAEQHITYCYPTMTLAKHGQKIRTCEELLSEERGKRGCCLDMALLFCSCLEAVGMHPLIILQDDHAFAGCWLVNEMFTDCINDDPTVITKRTAEGINEIILVETTGANEGSNISFDKAVAAANDKIKDIEKFSFVLDVARARLAGVQPVPQRIYNGHEYEVENPAPERKLHFSPDGVSETFSFRKDENEPDRFDLWERRLLDLSLRNNLLNIRFTKNTLRIMSPSLEGLVRLLYKNREIHIADRPDDWKSPADSKDLGERISDKDPILNLLHKELENDRLRSYQDQKTLYRTLTGLYRSSRLSIEESGANTLFLALGFLKWAEPGTNARHFAPIVLFPIRLERKSANKGYYMVSRGEDPLLNETLAEFLKQNYSINMPDLSSAMQNENGIDIKYILAAVRKAVMEQDKWDVYDEAAVSIFDFNRFVIWNDIRTNRASMLEHPLISSLVSGKLSENLTDDGCDSEDELPSEDVALPISADSSQLAAIAEAACGKSFCLHGPPGTGKSQTITNIISNALFHGKRVLFVAEKMAALEVVQKRLSSVGLAPFCLELHSNKTKKTLVMDRLRKTTEVALRNSDGKFGKEAAHLDELKRELNAHVACLHKVRGSGLSVYDCFVRYSAIEADGELDIPDGYIAGLTPELLREHTELAENFESAATAVAAYGNALKEIGLLEYSPDIRADIGRRISSILPLAGEARQLSGTVLKILGSPYGRLSAEQYSALYDISGLLLEDAVFFKFVHGIDKNPAEALENALGLQECLNGLKTELTGQFRESVIEEVDCRQLRQKWFAAEHKWALPKYIETRSIINRLSSYSKNGKRLDESSVSGLLDNLVEIRTLQERYEETIKGIEEKFGLSGVLRNAGREYLARCHAGLLRLQSGVPLLGLSGPSADVNGNVEINGVQHAKELELFRTAYGKVSGLVSELEEKASAGLEAAEDEDWLNGVSRILLRWQDNISSLRSKVAYNIVRQEVCGSGLRFLVGPFENGAGKNCRISDLYLKNIYRRCADYYISQDRDLSYFQSILFEDKIKRFRKMCREFEEITQKELVARITSMFPALNKEAAQSSDVGFLQKCIRNGCRGVSIRKLFETIPDLISRMCPAMLMSPLSVSQYLSPGWPEFDLVIFDEASQMPTCEAVAAISRGKCAVIVGDEHQLPPTSFFMADNYSEQHSESEDLESILEDCLALSMPQRHLLWHYRSRHESLITFSNIHFYRNSLMTFPSNDDMATKVSLEYVKGIYERGSGRNNKEEAKAVVEEIRKRLSDENGPAQSIGVVTFNVNQQSLIEDMLNDMLRRNPALELKAATMHEPVFVKNLENVQGDERDVILFSVGYGYDKFGKVAMNFGPLNRDGGERRLNVAVSRARYEMKVFSSLKAEDIDLYRSDAKGVAYLKSFLDYAERGKVALSHAECGLKNRKKDAFVESVASALRDKGYVVNTGIGASDYRVDIGIVDPENPGRYLLGLVCDGYNYTVPANASDRNVTVPDILSQLGWRTYNIWSVEWWDTPDLVLDGILRELDKIISAESPHQTGNRIAEQGVDAEPESESEPEQNAEALPEPESDTEAPVNIAGAIEYKAAELPARHADPVLFSQGYYTDTVVNDIRTVVDTEAPISRRLLIRRLLNSYGISRNGVRINAYLTDLFDEMELALNGSEDIFVWKDKDNAGMCSGYRTASGREALDIAPEEVAEAVMQVLKDQFAIDENGLISEASRLFGYANVRDNVAASMRRGIKHAVESGRITFEDGRYRVA